MNEQQQARYDQLVMSAKRIYAHWKQGGATNDQALDLAEASFRGEAEYQARRRAFLDGYKP
jgi:hypothetical protein